MSGPYNERYAQRYIEKTLTSPYTSNKNCTLAKLVSNTRASKMLDIGCNVSPLVKKPESLRFQAERNYIQYVGVDISPAYFNPQPLSSTSLKDSEVYKVVDGIAGDGRQLPVQSSSFPALVCADVIEHIPNPITIFQEMQRVLTNNGRAFIVVPSLYKLDLLNFDYIGEKRESTHKNKMGIEEWQNLWEAAGLTIDTAISKPLGIASGLSYLSWLFDDFVPSRASIDSKEGYSANSKLHADAKKILAEYDEEIDQIIDHNHVIELILHGELASIFSYLTKIITELNISQKKAEKLSKFFQTVSQLNFNQNQERIATLQQLFTSINNPHMLLGNSVIIALKHYHTTASAPHSQKPQ